MIVNFVSVWENFPLASRFSSFLTLKPITQPIALNASPTNPCKKHRSKRLVKTIPHNKTSKNHQRVIHIKLRIKPSLKKLKLTTSNVTRFFRSHNKKILQGFPHIYRVYKNNVADSNTKKPKHNPAFQSIKGVFMR
jgi:hypothetical protein